MVTEKYEKSMYFKTFSECEVYMVGCVKIWPMRVNDVEPNQNIKEGKGHCRLEQRWSQTSK